MIPRPEPHLTLARAHRLASPRDFRRVLTRGARASHGSVACAVQLREDQRPARVGVTATKRIGSAVRRNRAKRRLREAARATLTERAGMDVVLSARGDVLSRNFQALRDDVAHAVEEALKRC